jgi:hypothetical protein
MFLEPREGLNLPTILTEHGPRNFCYHFEKDWVEALKISRVQKGVLGVKQVCLSLEAVQLEEDLLLHPPLLIGKPTAVGAKTENPDIYCEGEKYAYLTEVKNHYPILGYVQNKRPPGFFEEGEDWVIKNILAKNWTGKIIQITKPVVRVVVTSYPVYNPLAEKLLRDCLGARNLVYADHPFIPGEEACHWRYMGILTLRLRKLLNYYEHETWKEEQPASNAELFS